MSISIDVAEGERIVILPRKEGRGRSRRKSAAAVSEQRGESVTALIRRDDVQFPIFVEVYEIKASRIEFGRRARRERRSGGQAETALAIADINIDAIAVAVRDDEVEDPVVVDVSQLDVSRLIAQDDWTAGGRGKPPRPITNLRRNQASEQMTSHHIEAPVAIDICENQLPRTFSDYHRRFGRGAKQ